MAKLFRHIKIPVEIYKVPCYRKQVISLSSVLSDADGVMPKICLSRDANRFALAHKGRLEITDSSSNICSVIWECDVDSQTIVDALFVGEDHILITTKSMRTGFVEVYKDMRKHLVAKFTRLRGEFSDKWLSCDAQAVEMEIIEDESGERKLYAKWKKPWDDVNLSVAIEGLSWTGRPLDKVRLKVVAFVILKIEAGQDSGGKEYVFSSAGKATECDKYTFKTQGKPFDDLATGGWKELDAAQPIAAVDVFTNSIPGGSPCITGLRIIYNTQRETKTVLHGNDDSSGSGGNISRNQLKIEVGVVWRTSLVTEAEYTRKVVTELSFHVLDRKTGNSTIAGPFGGANGEDVVSHHSGEVLAFTGREGQQGDRCTVVDVIQTELVFDDLVALGGVEKELDTARPITAIKVFTGSVNNGLSSFVSGLRITYNTRSGPKTFTHGNDNPYGAEGSTSRAEVKVKDNQRIAGVLWRMSNPLETKLGRKVVTEISFHIFDQKTGQSKVIGPFGGIYKESFASHYSGEVLAFTGTESGGGDRCNQMFNQNRTQTRARFEYQYIFYMDQIQEPLKLSLRELQMVLQITNEGSSSSIGGGGIPGAESTEGSMFVGSAGRRSIGSGSGGRSGTGARGRES
ncbi:hypothetical protein D9757_008318 [Collybiopsis confluens]|uniref:Jacalin-type lectin domain-containing protein n=1 Tax=Collybiopsis confluens TaxID=2823264 RepID=A0A8H5M5U1_9AGAR|nr:hypothetical protein D9757_008318 [Collybiopsis confluens]